MSVLTRLRKESGAEFENTARKLMVYSLRQCTKFPKRYTFYISTKIYDLAETIYRNVMFGNEINPKNAYEAQVRRDHFLTAIGTLDALAGEIGMAMDIFQIDEKVIVEWMNMVDSEKRMLQALNKKEAERYKDLK